MVMHPPTLYSRKYAKETDVSAADLSTAYQIAAQLVAEHGEDYLPLFERLDREVRQQEDRENIKRRAVTVAARRNHNAVP